MFGGHCAYCGKNIDFDDMTIDHVHPQCKGGSNEFENTYPCCQLCNNQKGSMSIGEFRDYIQNIEEQLDENKTYRLALRYKKLSIKQPKIKFFFEKYESHKNI